MGEEEEGKGIVNSVDHEYQSCIKHYVEQYHNWGEPEPELMTLV